MQRIGGIDVLRARHISSYTGSRGDDVQQPNNVIKAYGNEPKPKKNKKLMFKELGKIIGTIGSVLGSNVTGTTKEINKLLTKERVLFRKLIGKGSTAAKKLCVQKGSTKKEAKEVQQQYRKEQMDDMKKMLYKVQLHALKQINNSIGVKKIPK